MNSMNALTDEKEVDSEGRLAASSSSRLFRRSKQEDSKSLLLQAW
jgi:hypothetical protein